MLIDTEVLKILCIILGAVIAIGIVVILIMKKLKKSEDTITIVAVATIFAGVLLAGLLVYWVTLGMMMDVASSMQQSSVS